MNVRPHVLKYGIVTTSDALRVWQLACVRALERSGLAELRCALRIDGESRADHPHAGKALRRYCEGADPPSQRFVTLAALPAGDSTANSDRVRSFVPVEPSGLADRVRTEGLDFLLLFAPKDVAGSLRDTTKYGVWYFVHSDIAYFQTAAPCFWEIYHDHAVTGAALVKFTDSTSIGIILKSGYFATIHTSYVLNIERAFASLPDWPVQVCRELLQGVATYFDAPAVAQPPTEYPMPNALHVLALQIVLRVNAAREYAARYFLLIDWNIAGLRDAPGSLVGRNTKPSVELLGRYSPDRYLADPFVFAENGKIYVFFELYLHQREQGVIAFFELHNGKPSQVKVAIEEPHHLSYPQVFRHDGSIYCLPESADTGKLCLYEAIDFPNHWKRAHILLENFAAVDATIVWFEHKWWLFCTNGREGYNSHLYIWHSSDLFGPWEPHAKNPVKIDVTSAGSAGPFFEHENSLYRPAQDCSRTYGGQIRINKVVRLNETEFDECVVSTVKPPSGPYSKGIHVISSWNNCTVVDVKRYVFRPSAIARVLKNGVRKIAFKMGMTESSFESLKRRVAPPARVDKA